MQRITIKILTTILAFGAVFSANAQARYQKSARVVETPKMVSKYASVADSLLDAYSNSDSIYEPLPLPDYFFMPAVYENYEFLDTLNLNTKDYSGVEQFRWIEAEAALSKRMKSMKQYMLFKAPQATKYNIRLLPEAPKEYHAVVNPEDHTIDIQEVVKGPASETTMQAQAVKKRHWIQTFNASLQFSQAYVSPNWYQGGNNNLNALGNISYNFKLNQAYHPNLLFETTMQYKLAMNNAPEDSLHAYNITEDLFQVNTTFGLKAATRWYYSFTGQFKTQLVNSYTSNTNNLRSAFLSPGELTAGLGMTYNYNNKPKTFTFDASIAPLSYNMQICTNDRIDETLYNIEEGKTTYHTFGSSCDLKLTWKVCYNISLSSHLNAFTDFDRAQADWEATLAFEINRFLTTQIYAHARYDSQTPKVENTSWKKLQLKEILSIGFAYKFSSI
jgi:hypothetical protein